MADSKQAAQTDQDDQTAAGPGQVRARRRAARQVARLTKEIQAFAAAHGGGVRGQTAHTGLGRVRVALVATDGQWGNLAAETQDIALAAAQQAGVELQERFDGEMAAEVRTGPYEWSRMAGIQLGGAQPRPAAPSSTPPAAPEAPAGPDQGQGAATTAPDPASEGKSAPTASEPTAEPAAETVPPPASEPTAEAAAKPAPEPLAEAAPKSVSQPASETASKDAPAGGAAASEKAVGEKPDTEAAPAAEPASAEKAAGRETAAAGAPAEETAKTDGSPETETETETKAAAEAGPGESAQGPTGATPFEDAADTAERPEDS